MESIKARLSLIDKNIGTSATFTRRPITLRNHIPKKLSIFFLTGGAYAPYATCMVTPLGPIYHRRQAGTERSGVIDCAVRFCGGDVERPRGDTCRP